jgi:hypothetical protein
MDTNKQRQINNQTQWPLVQKRTIPTERPPPDPVMSHIIVTHISRVDCWNVTEGRSLGGGGCCSGLIARIPASVLRELGTSGLVPNARGDEARTRYRVQ